MRTVRPSRSDSFFCPVVLAGFVAAPLAFSAPRLESPASHPQGPAAQGSLFPDLQELDPGRLGLNWSVDGVPAGDLLGPTELRCWTSPTAGSEGEARAVSSVTGTRRWMRMGPLAWTGPSNSVWTDAIRRAEPRAVCGGRLDCAPLPVHAAQMTQGAGAAPCPGRNLRLAVIVDPRLIFEAGGVELAAAHVATILTFTAHILERDAGVRVTEVAIDLQTQLGGPWDLEGMDCAAGLDLLHESWDGGLPSGAHFGLLLSAASLTCSEVAGTIGGLSPFGVCASLSGPAQTSGGTIDVRAITWDLFNVAHTLGHALGAGHAGDYCPPLELCAPVQHFGPCQEARDCSFSGTLMGACHLCPGGIANIEARFHPVVAAGLQAHASAHLPPLPAVSASVPDRVEPGVPLSLSLQAGPQLAPPRLRFRFTSDQAWFERPMFPAGTQDPGAWQVVLPAGQCGETYELRFVLQDGACGAALLPDAGSAPTLVQITRLESLVSQGFESPSGWQDVDLGASGGHWQWATPLPAGLASPLAPTVPASGHACFLTGAHGGNSDVDGGTVALESAIYDLAPGPFQIRYAYYLGLSTPSPGDSLRVEVRSLESGGIWHPVATHFTPAKDTTHWRSHTVSPELLQSLGLSGGPGIQVRFLATDGDAPSLVEAAVDDFELFGQACFF